jgi:hypothetical protein
VGTQASPHAAGKYIDGLLAKYSSESIIHPSLSYTITQNLYSHAILGITKYTYGALIRDSLYSRILSGSSIL